jgi:carbon-monoxide dehydrogenase large subunit
VPTLFGQPVRRVEDLRLLRGRGRYVGDITVRDMLHVAFVRSPHAHARIADIDVADARTLPGVEAILTAADFPGVALGSGSEINPRLVAAVMPEVRRPPRPVLAAERAMHAGHAVAVVVASDRYLAEDAAEQVRVAYEPLPAVLDAEYALEPGAPILHAGWDSNRLAHFRVACGDAELAFREAAVVVREEFHIGRVAAVSMEPRGVLATYDRGTGRLTIWSSTQSPYRLRQNLCDLLGLPANRVRAIAPDVGGGFGPKVGIYPEELLVGILAYRLGCPVRWLSDRQEDLTSTAQSREQVHHLELAARADGTVLALRDRYVVDQGAFDSIGIVQAYNTAAHMAGLYRVPNLDLECWCAATNKVPQAAYRGAGRPEAAFVMERALDRLDAEAGLDPADVRRKNLVSAEAMPYSVGILYRDGVPMVYDGGDYPACLDRALELAGYARFRREQAEYRRQGRRVGVGISAYLEGTGMPPFESARVAIDPTGKVAVYMGCSNQGQGHQTVFAQVCADVFNVPLSYVTVVEGDTDAVPYGLGTHSSRTAVLGGSAALLAANKVRDKVLRVAAARLEVGAEDLDLRDGRAEVRGAPERSILFQELARLAALGGALGDDVEPALEATCYFQPETVTFAYGFHVGMVEVDEETGQVRVLRYAVVHDCGRVINPMIVEGQIHGGIAQGIGTALTEEAALDPSGQPLAASLMDYLLPTALEVPGMLLGHTETPSTRNPLGVKGVGEAGSIGPPPVIAAAIEDALSVGPSHIRRIPMTLQAVRDIARSAPS